MPDKAVKKLYRSGIDRMVAGVCAGVADYFAIDPTIVRVLWFLASFIGGIGVAAYIISLILIPENPEHIGVPDSEKKRSPNPGLVIGIGIVCFGLLMLFKGPSPFRWNYAWPFVWFGWEFMWSILLIGLGAWFIVHNVQKSKQSKNQVGEKTVAQRKLYRRKSERMLGGVCAGLADYWSLDVALVRVAYALFTLFSGFMWGIAAYLILLFVLPEEQEIDKKTQKTIK
jgi:phage shock protein C